MDLDFLKDVGEVVKGSKDPDAFEKGLVARVRELRLRVTDLDIQYDKGVATVMGMVADQATREKVILAVGNVKGVAKVKDSLAVGMSAAEQAAIRKETGAAVAKRAAEVKAAADKAAEKARKQAQAKLQLEIERNTLRKQIEARRRAAEEAASTTYTVKKGDSLRKIAKKHYGDESKWKAIFEANQPMITKADLIYVGQVLRIPKV